MQMVEIQEFFKTLRVCAYCGSRLLPSQKFCGNCASSTKAPAQKRKLQSEHIQTRQNFLGREDTFRAILPKLNETLNSQGGALRIIGEAGSGKTAVIHQLVPFLKNNGFYVIETKGAPRHSLIAFHPLMKAIAQLVGVTETTPEAELPTMEELADRFGISETLAAYLNLLLPGKRLVGHPANSLKDDVKLARLKSAIVRLMRRIALKKPLALIVDRFDRLDAATKDVLATLETLGRFDPLLVITTAREKTAYAVGNLWEDARHITQIELDGLRLKDSVAIGRIAMGVNHLPGEIEENLIYLTGGNPLKIFFLLDYLRERGALLKSGKTMLFHDKHRDIDMPQTLAEIMTARMDNLKPHLYELLRLIAILGEDCTLDALNALYPHKKYLKEDLEELAERRMIRIQKQGQRQLVSFSHNYIEDFILDEILPAAMQAIRPKVAEYLKSNKPRNRLFLRWNYLLHALHVPERAIEFAQILERGAIDLMEQLQFAFAIECLKRAAQIMRYAIATKHDGEILDVTQAKLAMILKKLAHCHEALGEMEKAAEVYRAIIGLADKLAHPYMALEAMFSLGEIYMQQARYAEAKTVFDKVLPLAEETGDIGYLAKINASLARWYRMQAKYPKALELLEKASEMTSKIEHGVLEDIRQLADILLTKGDVKLDEANFQEAEEYYQAAYRKALEDYNAPLTLSAIEKMAASAAKQKNYEKAIRHLLFGQKVARQCGDGFASASLALACGRYSTLKKDVQKAQLCFHEGLEISIEMNWRQGIERAQKSLMD